MDLVARGEAITCTFFLFVQATDTGGANGSIVLPEELNRPENQKLKGIVAKLRKVKEEFDADAGEQGPIGWADLIYVAGASKEWKYVFVTNYVANCW